MILKYNNAVTVRLDGGEEVVWRTRQLEVGLRNSTDQKMGHG